MTAVRIEMVSVLHVGLLSLRELSNNTIERTGQFFRSSAVDQANNCDLCVIRLNPV